jgi:uncharacterized RDD family membrane protein YckC
VEVRGVEGPSIVRDISIWILFPLLFIFIGFILPSLSLRNTSANGPTSLCCLIMDFVLLNAYYIFY